jgi:osmotically-inducible protein OsmY
MNRAHPILVTVALAVGLALLPGASLFAGGQPEPPSDEQVKRNIVDKLTWDDRVDAADLTVEVEAGQVTLSGTVTSHLAQRTAVEDAWSVDGVVAVNDRVEVRLPVERTPDQALEQRVRGVLAGSSEIDAQDISVTALGGVVTLEGTVDAYWKKLKAEDLAAGVAGVTGVSNELAVVPTGDVVDQTIADDVTRAVDRRLVVEAGNVDVRVHNGIVTLSGVVDSWQAHDAAYDAAVSTLGVQGVVDELLVEAPTPPPGKQPLTDDEIRKDVVEQLLRDTRIDATDVTVAVDDGVVTLTGTVPTYLSRLAAADAARLIPGVLSVDNELTVEPDTAGLGDRYLAARVQEALGLNADIDASEIEVDVQDSVATLRGTVDAAWKLQRAEEIASDVPGVVAVANELSVVPTRNILDETIARQVVRALERTDGVDVTHVKVEVRDGTVTLSGTVDSWLARDTAFNAALDTAGVRAVINDIEVGG